MKNGNAIDDCIAIIKSVNGDIEDKALIRVLVEKEYDEELSTYVALLIPVVLGRIIGKRLDVQFTDSYYVHHRDGTEKSGLLAENNYYLAVCQAMDASIENGLLAEDIILKTAIRSPEFKLLNDFILNGRDAKGIQFSPLHFIL